MIFLIYLPNLPKKQFYLDKVFKYTHPPHPSQPNKCQTTSIHSFSPLSSISNLLGHIQILNNHNPCHYFTLDPSIANLMLIIFQLLFLPTSSLHCWYSFKNSSSLSKPHPKIQHRNQFFFPIKAPKGIQAQPIFLPNQLQSFLLK